MHLFIQYLWENPGFFFSWMLFVVFSICLHEFMHAYIALKEGDDTAARLGHLTLNPFKQMGIFSLLMLVFIGFCWGMVPVDPRNFKRKKSDLYVSLAGPLTNLGLFLLFGIIVGLAFKFFPDLMQGWRGKFFVNMFFQGSMMNMVLFIFNMLPVPGFDGFVVVHSLLPAEFKNTEFFKGASIVIIMLAFIFSDKLFKIGDIASYTLINLVANL